MTFFFFFNDTATTEIYTLSLHDALPISWAWPAAVRGSRWSVLRNVMNFETPDNAGHLAQGESCVTGGPAAYLATLRSEEHTSELQSQSNLVCRLLLEKKKKTQRQRHHT